MKTTHISYGCIAIITDKPDGTARLVIKTADGKKVKDSNHKSRPAALAAWRRFCR